MRERRKLSTFLYHSASQPVKTKPFGRLFRSRVSVVPTDSIRRATVHYSGHVQGVGFRYSALQVAKGYDVTGFVENLPDGRVLLVTEGESHEIDGFLAAFADRMVGFIRKIDRNDVTGARSHRGFSIR